MKPETPTFDYGEPWHTDSARGVMSKTGGVICYPFGFVAPERKLADRITACVNACYGMADPAAEIEAMREAIREAHDALGTCIEFIQDAHIIEAQWDWEPVKEAKSSIAKLQPFIKP